MGDSQPGLPEFIGHSSHSQFPEAKSNQNNFPTMIERFQLDGKIRVVVHAVPARLSMIQCAGRLGVSSSNSHLHLLGVLGKGFRATSEEAGDNKRKMAY